MDCFRTDTCITDGFNEDVAMNTESNAEKKHYYNLTEAIEIIENLKAELTDTKLLATDNANWFDALKVDYDKLNAELSELNSQEPVAWLFPLETPVGQRLQIS